MPKTCVACADALQETAGSVPRPAPGRQVWAWACDDVRPVGLKLIFLIVTRAVSLLGLSRWEAWQKDAEILILRHQLAVAQRDRPHAHARLTGPDRAWLALLTGTLPIERFAAMRLIVTPATILRWHRLLPVGAAVAPGPVRTPADAPQCPVAGAAAGTRERVIGLPPDPRRTRRTRHHHGAVNGLADPQGRRD